MLIEWPTLTAVVHLRVSQRVVNSIASCQKLWHALTLLLGDVTKTLSQAHCLLTVSLGQRHAHAPERNPHAGTLTVGHSRKLITVFN